MSEGFFIYIKNYWNRLFLKNSNTPALLENREINEECRFF